MGRNKIKGGRLWTKTSTDSPPPSKNQFKQKMQLSTEKMSSETGLEAVWESGKWKNAWRARATPAAKAAAVICRHQCANSINNSYITAIATDLNLKNIYMHKGKFEKWVDEIINIGLQQLNKDFSNLPTNFQKVVKLALVPKANNITVLGQNLIPFEMEGDKIIMKAFVSSSMKRHGSGDWRSAIINEGIGQQGGAAGAEVAERSPVKEGKRITGQQAAEQGLALLLAQVRENNGELTSEQMTQLERLAMIAHTAQRQNAELDILRRREDDDRFWKRCHEGVKYLTTILAGITAYYILSMFGGLSGVLTAGASGLIELFFTLVVGIFTSSINGVAGWFVSRQVVPTAPQVLSNITATIMADARMAPVMAAMSRFGWSTQIVAWIILFFILLALFHIPRIISQANSIWTPFGGVGRSPAPAQALPPPAPVPRLGDQMMRQRRGHKNARASALAAVADRKAVDEQTETAALRADPGHQKIKGGGKRRTRRRRKKRKSTRQRRRKSSRRRRKRKSRRRLHKKELRHIVTQARRFTMAASDRRYNRPLQWAKQSRPSRAKGRKKRSRRIYW